MISAQARSWAWVGAVKERLRLTDLRLASKEAFRRAGGVEDEVNVAAFAEAQCRFQIFS